MVDFALAHEQDAAAARAAASGQMSDLMRQGAGRSSKPSAAPLAQALAAMESAKATGDPARIAQATTELDGVLDAARAAARPPRPDFAAGARPPAPVAADFNAQLRADRLGWH